MFCGRPEFSHQGISLKKRPLAEVSDSLGVIVIHIDKMRVKILVSVSCG